MERHWHVVIEIVDDDDDRRCGCEAFIVVFVSDDGELEHFLLKGVAVDLIHVQNGTGAAALDGLDTKESVY